MKARYLPGLRSLRRQVVSNEMMIEKHSECGLGSKNCVSFTDSWSHMFTAAAESLGLGRSSTSRKGRWAEDGNHAHSPALLLDWSIIEVERCT